MTIIYSFLFCGFICLIGQIILDNTSFTPGHITSIFVVLGSFLCSISLYEKILKVVGIGASLPIMSFGNLLTKGAYTGYLENGFIGIFTVIWPGKYHIIPDFEREILKGKIMIKGKIFNFILLKYIIEAIRNEDIKKVIQKSRR